MVAVPQLRLRVRGFGGSADVPRLQAPPGLLRAQEGELLIGFRSESLLASERPHLFGVRLFRLRTRCRHTGCFRRLMPQPDCPGRMNRPIKTVDGVSAAVFLSGCGQDAYSSAVTIPCTANLIGHSPFTIPFVLLIRKTNCFSKKRFYLIFHLPSGATNNKYTEIQQ